MIDTERSAMALGAELRAAELGEVAAEHHEQQRARLRATLDRLASEAQWKRAHQRFRPAPVLWVAAAAAAIALGLGSYLYLDRKPLGYALIEADGLAASTIEAPANAPLETRFSDGSTLRLSQGTRVRVQTNSDRDGTIVLERGTVTADFRSGQQTVGEITAGPFAIHAIGAELTASWDRGQERAVVRVERGVIRVESEATGSVSVRAGQEFTADVGQGTHAVGSAAARGSTPPTSTQPRAAATGTRDSAAEADLSGNGEPARPVAWAGLLANGDFDGVVRTARGYGLERCFASCSSADLRALGDAARYVGERELAEQALLALEKRPGSAAIAAFLLGRHHESRRPDQALRWYDAYLKRSPHGTYAAEAMAGKMRTLESVGDRAAARDVARLYLTNYPAGVQAERAKRVLGQR